MRYFIRNKLFSTKQFDFIMNESTVSKLFELLDKWTDWLESSGQIDVIYTDLEKVFDKILHNLILHKLHKYLHN